MLSEKQTIMHRLKAMRFRVVKTGRNDVFEAGCYIIKRYGAKGEKRLVREREALSLLKPYNNIYLFSFRNMLVMRKKEVVPFFDVLKKDPRLFDVLKEEHAKITGIISRMGEKEETLVWKNYLGGLCEGYPRIESLVRRIGSSLADETFENVIHGDFGTHNIFFEEKENRIVVLDYEFARKGNLQEDLAYFIYTILKYSWEKDLYFDLLERMDGNIYPFLLKAFLADAYWQLIGLDKCYGLKGERAGFSSRIISVLSDCTEKPFEEIAFRCGGV